MLTDMTSKLGAYGRLMRGRHWAKNLLVLIPLCVAPQLPEPDQTARSLLAVLSFALASSAVYCLNDVFDAPLDRMHPSKRTRPVASGEVTTAEAVALASILAALSAAPWILTENPRPAFVIAGYIALNMLYSMGLKKIAYLDAVLLSIGFPARMAVGSLAAGTGVQVLLCLTVQAFALYLTFGKRLNELTRAGRTYRDSLRSADPNILKALMLLSILAANIFYAAWCVTYSLELNKNPLLLALSEPFMAALSVKFHIAQLNRRDDSDMLVAMLSDRTVVAALAALVIAAITFTHI